MNKTILTIALLAATATASAQQTTRYEVDVTDFNELKVTDGINVDYVCSPDSAGKAVFHATPEMASQIIFQPDKSKLNIQLVPKAERVNRELPTVTVYSSYLTHVENDGDSLVRVLSIAPGPKVKARIIGNGRLSVRGLKANTVEGNIDTGNGTLVLYGTCNDAKLTCTGTGNIQADALEAQEVNVILTGTGTVGCNAAKKQYVKGLGSGKVYYGGNPEIKKRGVGIKALPLEEQPKVK